jgi:signal transduction histidine kinase
MLRTLVISVVPIVLIVALALAQSQRLLQERFNDEAAIVSGATANALANRVLQTSRSGSVLAALSRVRELAIAGDTNGLRELLIPLKSRLALDVVRIANGDGAIIAGAQDVIPGERLPAELLARALARAENSWVIYSDPQGLMIRSITPISGGDLASSPGFVEVGYLLDTKFLQSIRAESNSEIALIVGGQLKASTTRALDAVQLPSDGGMHLAIAPFATELTVQGMRYAAVFSDVQSHSSQPQTLLVLMPLGRLEAARNQLVGAVVAGGVVLVLLAALFAYRTARGLTKPLAGLASAAGRIEQGDLDVPVVTGSPHEIGRLEHSFKSMAGALRNRDRDNGTLVSELRAANARLAEASRLKSEFIANVSHELRTPMNAILGYTDFMIDGMDGPITELQAGDLRRVHVAAENLLGIINGLLDLAKIEAGQMDVRPEAFGFAKTADEVVQLLGERARAKGIVIRAELANDLPAVWADPHQIRQVLTNVVANAVKFTARGEIVITAMPERQVPYRPPTDSLQVTVRDTGEGIPPDALEIIFDEFRQADGSASRRHGGTGLGLAIARRLVEMNGGRIWVESELGVGSRFHFSLRIAPHVTASEPAVPTPAARA